MNQSFPTCLYPARCAVLYPPCLPGLSLPPRSVSDVLRMTLHSAEVDRSARDVRAREVLHPGKCLAVVVDPRRVPGWSSLARLRLCLPTRSGPISVSPRLRIGTGWQTSRDSHRWGSQVLACVISGQCTQLSLHHKSHSSCRLREQPREGRPRRGLEPAGSRWVRSATASSNCMHRSTYQFVGAHSTPCSGLSTIWNV